MPTANESELKLRYGRRYKIAGDGFVPEKEKRAFDWPERENDPMFQDNLKAFYLAHKDDKSLALICGCPERFRVRKPCGKCRRYVLEKWPGSTHDPNKCRRKSGLPKPSLVPSPGGHEGNGGEVETDNISIRLVLKSREEISDEFELEQGEHMQAFSCARGPIHTMYLGGLLGHLADLAGLTSWEPGRAFGNGPLEILMRMNDQCWLRPVLNKKFKLKTVFAPLTSDIDAAIDAACNATARAARNLSRRALLINSQLELPPTHKLKVKFGESANLLVMDVAEDVRSLLDKNERVAAGDTEELERWRMLQFPKDHPRDSSLLYIALVEPDDPGFIKHFRIEQLAWRLMDNRGLLYESTSEFEAGAQLFRAGIQHWKPAHQSFRISGTNRKPDFLIWDRKELRCVLEVDPGGFKLASKELRNIDFNGENAPWYSWNSTAEPDLLKALKAAEFNW